MKKVLKLLVAIILAVIVIGGVLFLIDCSEINSGRKPKFAVVVNYIDDGGTTEYMGIGYKIIDFNMLNGYDEIKIGSWFMKYEDFEEEYKKLDIKIDDNKIVDQNENLSGDIVNDNTVSGDITIGSGDILSGDKISGDINDNEITSGDSNLISGDTSGDKEAKDDGYYFNATIIGVNKNNLIVQALENEDINASSDMFSFSLNVDNNANSTEYLIGQKVRINYTGTIRETYPAQIDVIGIEIIE